MTLCNEWNHHENIHCVIVNNKYAFTGYIRKWVSDKKSDRQKAAFSVHTGWYVTGKPKKEKFKSLIFWSVIWRFVD